MVETVAPGRSMTRRRLDNPTHTAIHEAGHAVARLVLDELAPMPAPPIDYIEVCTRGTGQDAQFGYVCGGPRVRIGDRRLWQLPECALRNALIRFDVIDTWAGLAAEARYRSNACVAILMLWKTVPVWMARTDTTGSDSHSIRERCLILADHDHAEASAEARRCLDSAMAIVAAEYPGIVRVGRILEAAGRMDGDEFESAWREVRPSPAMRARLLRQQGPGYPAAIGAEAMLDAARALMCEYAGHDYAPPPALTEAA